MIVLVIVSLYVASGAAFALLFAWRGVERLDPAARGAPWTFRLLLLPGAAALWPLLAWRWVQAAQSGGASA